MKRLLSSEYERIRFRHARVAELSELHVDVTPSAELRTPRRREHRTDCHLANMDADRRQVVRKFENAVLPVNPYGQIIAACAQRARACDGHRVFGTPVYVPVRELAAVLVS